MHYPREGLSTRLRTVAAVLSLGSLLSFGLGQALGHWPAFSGTATHGTSMQHQAVSAGATLATADLAAARARSLATPHITTEGDGGHAVHADHAGDHGHAGKHPDPHNLSKPPKGSTDGSSGGDPPSTN